MMTAGHGLSRLQVSKPRHDRVSMRSSDLNQRQLKYRNPNLQFVDGITYEKAHVCCDLIISRAGSMQFLAGIPDQLSQP